MTAPGATGLVLAVAAQLSPEQAEQQACGSPGQAHQACLVIYRLTHSQHLARIADVIITQPLKILLIVGVAVLAHLLARRAINRFVAGVRLGGRGLGRLRRLPLAEAMPTSPRAAQRAQTIGSLLRSMVAFGIWAIAVATILADFGINLGPLIAGAGIVGVGIGFGAQTLVKDFLTGMFMLVEDQYGVGDVVDTGLATGVVEGISLRATRLRDDEGTVWYVPHSSIQRIGNRSQGGDAAAPRSG
ncbi:MAG TPA: mechanosensitive ion channel domain-containing protein [Acidimicrobiales bacterium]|nr:mechanosensitive ion channel domain-containing protein [Acidimicrobiales bacterium]